MRDYATVRMSMCAVECVYAMDMRSDYSESNEKNG